MEYTIKQISEYLEVTKPTVQKIVNDLELEPVRTDNRNCQYYSYQDTVRIIQNRKPDFDLSLLPEPQSEAEGLQSEAGELQSETEKPQNRTAKTENETEKLKNFSEKPQNQTANPQSEAEAEQAHQIQNGNQRELDLLQELVKTIQKELEEKNKQLEIKDKQIQDLSDRLAEAMQLTRGQQYIAAADKTKDLVDKEMEKEADTIDVSPAAVPSHIEPDPEEERPQKKKGILARIFGW